MYIVLYVVYVLYALHIFYVFYILYVLYYVLYVVLYARNKLAYFKSSLHGCYSLLQLYF